MKRVIFIILTVIFAVTLTLNYSLAKGEKVTLCHKPGTPAEKTISVASSAVEAHLNHGDYLGECSADCPPCPECDEPQLWLQLDQFDSPDWVPLQDLFELEPFFPFSELNVYYGISQVPPVPPNWYSIICEGGSVIEGIQVGANLDYILIDVAGCSVRSSFDSDLPTFFFHVFEDSVMAIYENGTVSFFDATPTWPQ